ncbi:MAG TPA: PQQ-binding-like beta-propeller repeat protein [Solirubrobacterales bacterium]|nr:PQQ-binding-like beta-propeller repeat protein [Solirubrobacterales bacterium]
MGEILKRVPAQTQAGMGAIALLLALAALLGGCGGGGSSEEEPDFTGSGYPNGDLANTRNVAGPIKTANVKQLEEAWSLPIEGESSFGSYASSPIMSKGVVYSQDLASNVQAIDQDDGEVLWTKSYEQPDHGPNGVVVAEGMVFGATPTGAFALDQKTGKEKWSVTLTRVPVEGIDIAPGYHKGVVYVSTVPVNVSEFYGPGGVGTLYALDAKTGKKLWHFDTVPKSLWGNPKVNSGGGLWYTPAFDGKGSMYFGVGNAGPFPGTAKDPWGASRPGPNLYTNSIVKMDAKTGKMDWYWQQLPHAVYDWDFQGPPILTKSGGKELVLAAGKSGVVVALDAQTGKPVWQKAVGKHNGHDDDNLLAMRGEGDKIKLPATVYPGALGGVIAPMATDGDKVYVPVCNSPMVITSQEEREEPGPTEGEIVALDVKTGTVEWKHKFPTAFAFGFTTVVNDLVFATTADGKVHGFDTSSGRLAWQAQLPSGTNAGVMVEGDTLLAPAGLPSEEGGEAQLVAYRLGG